MTKPEIKRIVRRILGSKEKADIVESTCWIVWSYLNPRALRGSKANPTMEIPDKTYPLKERRRYANLLRIKSGSPAERRLTDDEYNLRMIGKYRGKGRPSNEPRDLFLNSLAAFLKLRKVSGHHAKSLRIAESCLVGEPLPVSPAELRKLRQSLAVRRKLSA